MNVQITRAARLAAGALEWERDAIGFLHSASRSKSSYAFQRAEDCAKNARRTYAAAVMCFLLWVRS